MDENNTYDNREAYDFLKEYVEGKAEGEINRIWFIDYILKNKIENQSV